jgi:hypothetical protein
MGTGKEDAVGGKAAVPSIVVLDVLVSVFVSMDAFLGQVVLAEEAMTTVGDNGPNDAILNFKIVSG